MAPKRTFGNCRGSIFTGRMPGRSVAQPAVQRQNNKGETNSEHTIYTVLAIMKLLRAHKNELMANEQCYDNHFISACAGLHTRRL